MTNFLSWLFAPLHRALVTYMSRSGLLLSCADAPDMTAANESAKSSAELAREQWGVAKDLIPYYRERQDKLDALTTEATNAQLGIMRQSADQATDYYDYSKETFRPVEQGLVSEVLRDSTPEAYARLASTAAARTGVTFRNMTAAAERASRTMGVDPSSGQARGIQRAATMQAAASGSAAFNDAFDQAQQRGYARKLDVVGIGRGLSGASTAAYGAATGAGSAATGAGNDASRTAGSTIGTPTQWGGQASDSQQAATSGYVGIANAQNQANASNGQVLGSIVGAGAGLYAMGKF